MKTIRRVVTAFFAVTLSLLTLMTYVAAEQPVFITAQAGTVQPDGTVIIEVTIDAPAATPIYGIDLRLGYDNDFFEARMASAAPAFSTASLSTHIPGTVTFLWTGTNPEAGKATLYTVELGLKEMVSDGLYIADLECVELYTYSDMPPYTKDLSYMLNNAAIRVGGLEISPPSATLIVGQTIELNADRDVVRWESDNIEVALVDADGRVTAKASGTASIFAYGNEGYYARSVITVHDRTLTGIRIVSPPNKTVYLEGETLEITGMLVEAMYDSGTAERIHDPTIKGYDPNRIGDQTITVSWGGKSAVFTATVQKRPKEVPNKITSSTYSIKNGILGGIKTGTKASQLINGLNEREHIKLYSGNTVVRSNSIVHSGMIVLLLDGEIVRQELVIAVTGTTAEWSIQPFICFTAVSGTSSCMISGLCPRPSLMPSEPATA